ncbi:DUF748 domain-containing protein [Aliidiomarina sp. Khilg15.8]
MHSGSLHDFGSYLRKKWASPRRVRFWLVVLVILYTLLGFLVLPQLIHYLAENTAKEDFGRELRIESVRTNPYTLTLDVQGVELDDIDDRKLIGWDRLFVDLAWSSVTNRAWTFETIRLDQPVIQEERFVAGDTRFSRLASEFSNEEDSGTGESEPLPAVRLNQLRVEDGIVRFTDNLKNPRADADEPMQVSLALQNIGLSVNDFVLQKDVQFPVSLEGQLREGGKLTFDGKLQVLPALALEASTSIDELALDQAEPYLRQFLNARLDSGALTLDGNMQIDAEQPFAFQGSASIDSLGIRDGSNDESLAGWENLQLQRFELSVKDKELEMGPITVEGPSARVVIHEDKSTNVGLLLVRREGDSEENGNDAEKDGQTAPPFSMAIERIELKEGTVQFADNSLPLPFSTRIHALNGEISTLSSTSAEPARVKLQGQVGEFGAAHIEGFVHAWHPMQETRLDLRFRNLQIPEYSPYTVDFAGRRIAEGTMDLDLGYTIQETALDGENKLLLYDVKLGEKMASSNAMDLPLDLAVSLLENSDGVIDLTLPVEGDVGNPEFDFSAVIQQAVGDAIKSVVTAPFSFLASLVGADEEDLGRVEFQAGNSELLPPQRERITKLREALNQRPKLVLELSGPFNQSFDGPVLKREKAVASLQQRLAEEGRDVEDPSLTAESNQEVVETMFSDHYPDTDLAALKNYFTEEANESDGESKFDALAYRNYLAEEITAAQSITDVELQAVANARAEAAREALVNSEAETTIAADRVRILEPSEVGSVDGERIAMEVGISAG